jgi:hypothetical protein
MLEIRHKCSPDVVLVRLAAPDLNGCDLSGRFLLGAQMLGLECDRADFHEANLKRAVLAGCNLRAADLRRATLHEADLTGAELRGADLTDADLSGAMLAGADLSGATLCGANLDNADLCDALLDAVHYDDRTRWPTGFSLETLAALPEAVGTKGGHLVTAVQVPCVSGEHLVDPSWASCPSCLQRLWATSRESRCRARSATLQSRGLQNRALRLHERLRAIAKQSTAAP